MITEYDPNKRWHPQTVKIVVMQFDYKKEIEVTVGGNCLGFDIFDSAIENVVSTLPVIAGDFPYIILENSKGDTLRCEDEDDEYDEWLKNMIVSIEILKQADKAKGL